MATLICIPPTKVTEFASRAPKTATATAPPTWRKVLNTALAVPAHSGGTLSKPVITGTATDPPGPMRISSTAVNISDPKGAVRTSAVSPTTMDTWPGTAGAEG